MSGLGLVGLQCGRHLTCCISFHQRFTAHTQQLLCIKICDCKVSGRNTDLSFLVNPSPPWSEKLCNTLSLFVQESTSPTQHSWVSPSLNSAGLPMPLQVDRARGQQRPECCGGGGLLAGTDTIWGCGAGPQEQSPSLGQLPPPDPTRAYHASDQPMEYPGMQTPR